MKTPRTYLLTVHNSKAQTINMSIGKPYSPWTKTFTPAGTTMSGLYRPITQNTDSIDSILLTQEAVASMR